MDMLLKLLLYCDKRRYLSEMRTVCEDYLENVTEKTLCKFPPLRFLLEIDVIDLIECFPDLANLLMKEPLKWQLIINDILFMCIQSIENENKEFVQKSQVAITLTLKCISPLIVKPNAKDYKGLAIFDGILLSISNIQSYVYHSVWSCPEECEGNVVILQYAPKSSPKCYLCKSVLFENSSMLQCGDKVIATFMLKDRPVTKKLTIVDDMIKKLKLGSRYFTYSVVLKKLTTVWGLEEIIPLATPTTSVFPHNIQDSCWKYVYSLASGIGIKTSPWNCFMHLKIGLLLSLVSVQAHLITGSNILHIFVTGYDTGLVNEIIQDALKLADRFEYLSPTSSNPFAALIKSSGGVCVVPYSTINLYNQKLVSKINYVVESGEVLVDNVSGNLKCAVWAQCNNYKKISFNVASVFGTAFRGDFGEHGYEIANFILERATEPSETSKEDIQASKDLMTLVDLVAGIEVVLDETAEFLLKSYFLAVRSKRSDVASVGSLSALVAICVNIARLCRRKNANIDDAVFAIWLNVSGSPEPRFAPEEFLQTPGDFNKLTNMLTKFKDWLRGFIDTFNPEITLSNGIL